MRYISLGYIYSDPEKIKWDLSFLNQDWLCNKNGKGGWKVYGKGTKLRKCVFQESETEWSFFGGDIYIYKEDKMWKRRRFLSFIKCYLEVFINKYI